LEITARDARSLFQSPRKLLRAASVKAPRSKVPVSGFFPIALTKFSTFFCEEVFKNSPSGASIFPSSICFFTSL